MKWRVIPLQVNDAFMSMAIDEALVESVSSGAPPTIRFYRWKPSAVSIGYFQSLLQEVDVEECRRRNVSIVRRRTGGGAVYHDYDGEITYSLLAPLDLYGPDIPASYRIICGYVIESLGLLGLRAKFRPINDVVVNGRKISGNAQTRREGVLLQHGTVLHRLDLDSMSSVLKVGEEKLRDKQARSIREALTSVIDQLGEVPMEKVYDALLAGFTSGKSWEFGMLGREELERARVLSVERYGSREWNFQR